MRKRLALFVFAFFVFTAHAEELRLPFDGRWFVVQGGDTLNVNHHMQVKAQWFGLDFAKLGGALGNELAKPNPSRVDDFYAWGADVLAPADGEVQAAVDGISDNALGARDAEHPGGNYVSIKISPGRYLFLAHLRQGSLMVKPGQHVVRGQVLGRCGNSGNSDYPHLHLHIQNLPEFGAGEGQNPIFSSIDVVLSGKSFLDVSWPLISGLFVSPH